MRATQGLGAPRRLAAMLVSSLLLATLAACTEGGNGADDEAPGVVHSDTGTSPSDSESPGTGTGEGGPSEVADPAHAVESPGPFESPLTYVDMLIKSPQPIDESVVDKIKSLPQVDAVARISVAQVPIEGRVYNLAAVDPATYRNFTKQPSALHQEQWDRIAGGEMAVDSRWRQTLPIDEQGYLQMGPEADAPRIHVGAFSEQVPGIDLVVNEKWGESLEMIEDNALVTSSALSGATPQRLRKPMERLIGENASVQLTDIATLSGIDPKAVYTVNVVGSYAQAVGNFTYRVIGGRVVPSQKWVDEYIETDTVPVLGTVTCNKHMMPQLKAALGEIVDLGLASKLHPEQYAGCYYPRFIAGSTKLSNHAFGLALDVNVPGNQRGTVGEIDRVVVAIFKRWGFGWGGDWNYTDPMHFELSRIVKPGG